MNRIEPAKRLEQYNVGADEKVEISHIEDGVRSSKMTAAEVADAQKAAMVEHSLSVKDGLRIYKKAVLWSVVVSFCIIMESYDTVLLGAFFAYPTFQQKFGDRLPSGAYSVPAPWQIALSQGGNIGIIIGIFANGVLVDKFGHRNLLLVSLVVLSGFITLTFAASSRGMLLAGQILCGLPCGTINTIAPSYAVEVAPLVLRPYGPTFVNLCWVIGHIIGAGVLDGLVSNKTQWGWRIPFALQWMFPLPLFIILIWAPPSPWWLVRKGKIDQAEATLGRLSDGTADNHEAAALIDHTVQLERELGVGGSYAACFRGTDLRRTEIACVSWASQTLSGFAVQGYSTYLFTLAGLNAADAYKLTLGQYALAFVGTAGSMFLQAYFGRRTIFIAGLCYMGPIMLLVGILACVKQTSSIILAQGVLILVWFFGYGFSLGPLAFVIASEIGSAQLRQKTLALSRNAFNLLSLINGIVAPYLLNPTEANLKAKTAFLPAFFICCILVWAYYRLPETKGRSFEELDILFARGVPARQFASYVIDTSAEFQKPEVVAEKVHNGNV